MWSRPDSTVWTLSRAKRAAVLVDMQAYFHAARSAMEKAERSIHLLGWSFDPDARFDPDDHGGGPARDRIAAFLRHLAFAKPQVDVRLLVWKSALPVAATQNFFPHRARRAFRDTPVRFRLDSALPLGACHHQKAVVIDDRVAFCGGGDIAPDRWDTPGHLDDDGRRTSRTGRIFDARHEVMAVVDGPAARALGDLFRDRWRLASGQRLDAPPEGEPNGEDPWPDGIVHRWEHPMIGLARTRPAWGGEPQVREAEALHLAAIAGARRCIYLENQYLASPIIAEALAARLAQRDGPEVVLVSTLHSPSWFDRMTMDRTRSAFLQRLTIADDARGGPSRLHAYCPVTRGGRLIIVHAKLAIIDDVMLRVGSANINNRSTGFDTECDLVIEAEDGPAGASVRADVAGARSELIAHWLGRSEREFDGALRACGSVAGAIEALDDPAARRLRPLKPQFVGPLATLIAKYHLGDPAGPEDSWAPWTRREAIKRQLADMSHRLAAEGLPAPVDKLSAETI